MKPMLGVVLAICALLGVTDVASGQVPTGIIPFGSYDGSVDTVNLANLNVHLDIPIRQKAGRGLPFRYDLSYDSSIWYPSTVGGGGTWLPVANWGWKNSGPTLLPYVSYSVIYTNGSCTDFNQFMRSWQKWSYSGFVYHDSSGTSHPFNSSGAAGVYTSTNGSGGTCPNAGTYPTPYPTQATDGSGYTLNATIDSSGAWGTVISVIGAILSVPFGSSPAPGPIAITDANGNQLTVNNAVYTDTLGTTALTVAGTAPSPTTFTYTGPSGPAAYYTVSYASYTVTTNFGCPNTTEYSHASYLADRVTLPDNTYYQFTYEKTTSTSASVTGRLASVTLPTGGTISYTYLNGTGTGSDPINCVLPVSLRKFVRQTTVFGSRGYDANTR